MILRGDRVWIYPTEQGEDADTPFLVTSKEEGDGDNLHLLVNITGLEDKHVKFVDVQRGKKVKDDEKKRDDGWEKLGRRTSLTVGLGKPWDRKGRSMERMGMLEDEVSLARRRAGQRRLPSLP